MEFAKYPSLAGARVFITGGAAGIGAAMVKSFTEQGAIVGYVDIDQVAADDLQRQIVSDGHSAPWFRLVDVTQLEELQQAVSDFGNHKNGLSVLVNNVANDTRHEPLEVTPESWRYNMAVNLDPAFFAAQAAIKIMQKSDGGSIVNFSSINAILGPTVMPGYVTAKAGLMGLTKALARQFGKDRIRVNTILPGWVVTERQLQNWLTEEAEAEWMEQVCLRDRIEPHDVANLAMFLASADSRMITNQHFAIDAGRT